MKSNGIHCEQKEQMLAFRCQVHHESGPLGETEFSDENVSMKGSSDWMVEQASVVTTSNDRETLLKCDRSQVIG